MRIPGPDSSTLPRRPPRPPTSKPRGPGRPPRGPYSSGGCRGPPAPAPDTGRTARPPRSARAPPGGRQASPAPLLARHAQVQTLAVPLNAYHTASQAHAAAQSSLDTALDALGEQRLPGQELADRRATVHQTVATLAARLINETQLQHLQHRRTIAAQAREHMDALEQQIERTRTEIGARKNEPPQRSHWRSTTSLPRPGTPEQRRSPLRCDPAQRTAFPRLRRGGTLQPSNRSAE